jgi:hypothetical protein
MSVLYLLLLVAVALLYLLDSDLATEDKVLAMVGVAGLPAAAFVAAAMPLLRSSQNRVALVAGATLAVIAAFFQLMLTFGFAFPLSIVLLGVAVVDANRAARLSGVRKSRRLVALAATLALWTVAPVISFRLAVGLGAVVVAVVLWKLISPRLRPPAAPDERYER